ncbi:MULTISPECIES: hypothetical protein [Gimesia]|uniref:Uncharacterized protein n=1 Tax=Gimesia chilikensis TaxID=2605989 RepID=A0A517PZ08_9PLAN|nr:hypothetical protein [Gimesia chilikensis]QDT24611.1 hypothetical protein HG66A1_64450 [Gimesia chilikensis]
MGESTKAVCALLMIVSGIAAAFAWMADRPDAVTWGIRIGGFVSAMLMLGVILKLHFRADLEHDYLRQLTGTYFNRDDFCFAFLVTPHDGLAFMDAYFQTQRDQPCMGQIALRPARGFFLTRANFDAITFEVECPPAGFGFARIAIPIPEKLQGKRLSFEVGACVRYPEGKGRRVRFHDGIFLRSNSNFGNSFGTALTAAGAATGSLVLSSPATANIELPADVAEEIPNDLAPEIKILWQLGEPPLENVG